MAYGICYHLSIQSQILWVIFHIKMRDAVFIVHFRNNGFKVRSFHQFIDKYNHRSYYFVITEPFMEDKIYIAQIVAQHFLIIYFTLAAVKIEQQVWFPARVIMPLFHSIDKITDIV